MGVTIQINPGQKTGSSLNQRKKAFCQVFQAVLLIRATDVSSALLEGEHGNS